MKTVVIIATKGRPQEVSNLIGALGRQSVRPDKIVVSACEPSDTAQIAADDNLKIVFGSPGSSVQRNRGLSLVRGKCDVVVFFDDDFVPSRYWIEYVQDVFSNHPDVVSATGVVLVDGVISGGIAWSDGQLRVDEADRSKSTNLGNYGLKRGRSPYGCNMAFRASAVDSLTFDERLALYGWLEDLDFSARASRRAGMIATNLLWGVHLGSVRARTSGLRYGYSQVVNPWYLRTKGSMTYPEAVIYILRGLVRNAFGTIFPNSTVDRLGRFKGNLIGLKDIVTGRSTPERVTELPS
jgi:glycosyltransferase involved in cell wall biosynthesis